MFHLTSKKDFEKKEKSWKGFKYGLEQRGLNIDEVRKRLKKGKTPWIDERDKERIIVNTQKNWLKFKDNPEK